jgi:hypothetical protein
MPATVKFQFSVESLAETIRSLNLPEKRQLAELLDQQIFEAEEENYEDDPETIAELQAVQAEYDAGNFQTFDSYVAGHATPVS